MQSIKRKQTTSIRKSPIYSASYKPSHQKGGIVSINLWLDNAANGKGEAIEDLYKIFPKGQSCVYVLTDPKTKPLYVGMTSNLTQRMENHKYTKSWFEEVSNVLVYPCHESLTAKIEKETIAWLNPPYNKSNKNKEETFLAPNFLELGNMDFRFYVELHKRDGHESDRPFLDEIMNDHLVRKAQEKMLAEHEAKVERSKIFRKESFENRHNDPLQPYHTKYGEIDKPRKAPPTLRNYLIKCRYTAPYNDNQIKFAQARTKKELAEHVKKFGKSEFVRKHLHERHHVAFAEGRLNKFDNEIDQEINLRLQNLQRAGWDFDIMQIVKTYS